MSRQACSPSHLDREVTLGCVLTKLVSSPACSTKYFKFLMAKLVGKQRKWFVIAGSIPAAIKSFGEFVVQRRGLGRKVMPGMGK